MYEQILQIKIQLIIFYYETGFVSYLNVDDIFLLSLKTIVFCLLISFFIQLVTSCSTVN